MPGDDGGPSRDATETPTAVPFESFPDPLLAFGRGDRPDEDGAEPAPEDATPVVRGVNAAFEATFDVGDGAAGTPLDEVELTGVVLPASAVGRETEAEGDEAGVGPGGATDGDAAERRPLTSPTAAAVLDRAGADPGAVVDHRPESDGETRHFSVRTVPGTDADAGFLLFGDVTRVERRRRELASTVERLERIERVASHDIRNPLEVAKIRLEAARDTGEAVHFEKVAGALDRIDAIVRDVLSVGGGDVTPTDVVALGDVAEAAWDTVDTGDATLVVADGLPTVRCDADRLQQLFENLFRNAVEHGSTADRAASGETDERRGRSVTVTVAPRADGFVVADDGAGVPAEIRERVFEPGYSTVSENSGIGLAIVRRLARAHGWRVSLGSDEDRSEGDDGGARFRFSGVDPVESDD